MKPSPLRLFALALLAGPAALLADQTDDAGRLRVAAPSSAQPGTVAIVTVSGAPPDAALTAAVLGQNVALYRSADGASWSGLVGVDLETRPGDYPILVEASSEGHSTRAATALLRVTPKSFPTRRLRVAGRFVDPPAAETERILREAERLASVLKPTTPRHWAGPFVAPLAGTPSSNFGSRSIYNGQPRSPHAGVDFRGEVGAPITAPNAGAVVLAEDLFFTGHTVVLDHGAGLYSLFAHLSRIDVEVGQPVAKGAAVGLLGATGRVTGPHLHWAVRLNGARVDPMSLIAALQEQGP